MSDILVSVSTGLFGLAGAGLLSRVVGPLLWRRRAPGFTAPKGFVALIPAHDEESLLPATLASLRVAAARADVPLRILVGADACTDSTVAVAESFGAEVETQKFRSKWKTVASLSKQVRHGEWAALVDAGALWPPELLVDLAESFHDPGVLAIAPAYFPKRSSSLERMLWRFEARWKNGENGAGGPVSVHGATVFFRGEALHAAMERLSRFKRASWLNDDVVLPFAARLAYPGGAIRYWCPPELTRRVSDAGLKESAPQFGRRRRMVAGNLEWAITLLPAALINSPAAALVSLRRLSRIFWAYWIFCLLYAPCFALLRNREASVLTAVALSLVGAIGLTIAGKRSVVEAAAASILAPFFLPQVLLGRSQAWS